MFNDKNNPITAKKNASLSWLSGKRLVRFARCVQGGWLANSD
ncbi:Uncharacterized protein dnm_081990 [Desulfonema magnum]|uniref:Uncharacterized protein n=1 Tax=Desulfonema magnum TaxID=45655 RepID=A0A975BVS1_9BACT|nr:Uncharacterized protein dnm_081990 [Desulfonema magnum]